MKLLIVTNHFFPESFRVNDIASELAGRGHDVTVFTAIPDYPQGKFYDGYSLVSRRREVLENGVKVVRFPIIPRGKGKKVNMMLNYSSSLAFSIFHSFSFEMSGRFDCIFVHDTSPAFISIPAQMIGKVKKIPVVHWILDIWPDSLVAGNVHSPALYRRLSAMMDRIYRRDDGILVSSKEIGRLLRSRGVPEEKIGYLPNWSDVADVAKECPAQLPEFPSGFNIVFTGNLGAAQNLENLMKAAELCRGKQPKINWIFVGDGRKRASMEEYVKEHKLDNVFLPGRFPIETMGHFFRQADVLLVSLSSDPIFSLTLPAKVQAYMAAGKPVFSVMKGEGARVVNEASCGLASDPDDVQQIAGTAMDFAGMERGRLEGLGENARRYYNENFSRKICIDRLENVLIQSIERFLK